MNQKSIEDELNNLKSNEVVAFVRGTYNDNLKSKQSEKYGYGDVILVKPDNQVLEKYLYSSAHDPRGLKNRNVAGELFGAEEAVKWAVKMKKFKKIHIYCVYSGIKEFANDYNGWKGKNEFTKEYHDFMKEKEKEIEIIFTEIDASEPIVYNKKAGKLAKDSLTNEEYRTYKDGSVYLNGLPLSKWDTICENVQCEVSDDITIEKDIKKIKFEAGNEKVFVSFYDVNKAYIQGSLSHLFNIVFENALGELETKKEVISALNHYHNLDITEEELNKEYAKQLPLASKKEKDNNVINTLTDAVYNTMLIGYKPDYSDLISPITRIMEYYLHAMFGSAKIDTEMGSNKRTYLNYFMINDKGYYVLNPNQKELKNKNKIGKKLSSLSNDKKSLIEQIYNWYHFNRNSLDHWQKNSENNMFIKSMAKAKEKIFEGEHLIEKYYEIFR